MGLYLNPSNRMFQVMLDSSFYVDRTGIASFVNGAMGRDGRFIAVSRPRRFGKSVDANMLVAYYSRGCDSRMQFEGLDIARDPGFERHLNAHDVIKLDMSQIMPLVDRSLDVGAAVTRELLSELRTAWPSFVKPDETNLPRALSQIEEGKGTGFVFVIDGWDCVMREAADEDAAQRGYLDFLRDLLKGRSYVDACYMTGILPIRKYGRHSALNMFHEYTMTSPKRMVRFMGFSADEVQGLCKRFGMNFAEMQRWYDGYLVGPQREHVYNPNSVANAIAEGECLGYWTETETYEALATYIDMDFDGVQQDLVAMLDGQHVPTDISTFENDMRRVGSKDDVYTLLVHLGYLGYDQVERSVFIPNEEVRREFAASLRAGSRPLLAELVRDSRELQRRTPQGDEAYVADAVRRAHDSAAGPHYYND